MTDRDPGSYTLDEVAKMLEQPPAATVHPDALNRFFDLVPRVWNMAMATGQEMAIAQRILDLAEESTPNHPCECGCGEDVKAIIKATAAMGLPQP